MFVLYRIHVGNGTHTVLRAWEFLYIIRYNAQFHLGTTSLMEPLLLSPLGGPLSEALLYYNIEDCTILDHYVFSLF